MAFIAPLGDLIVIKRDDPLEKIGSFFIPSMAQEELDQGVVIACGPGKRYNNGEVIPLDIKAGDRVMYSKFANLKFEHEGVEYVTMHEADIIGVV